MEPKIIKEENQEDKLFNNQKKVLVLSILCMVVLLLSSSYAIMINFSQKDDAITFSTGNLEMTILNGEETFSLINLNNKLPESDQSGLDTATVIPITLKNTGTMLIGTYKIKLISDPNKISTLSEEYIRFSVSEDNITYSTTSTLTGNDNIIYAGTDLDINQTKTIYLKIWVLESAEREALDKVFYGGLEINLLQQEKYKAPTILNVNDAGNGKITFTAVENSNPISMYCVNRNQEDTSDCIWYEAVVGEQTTRQLVSTSGTYYLHLKDNKDYISHSEPITITISETVSIDLSGNDNNGTISGATLTSDGLSFDGTNDYIVINNMKFNSTKELTIEFIAKIEETDLGIIIESSTNYNNNPSSFYIDINEWTTNKMGFAFNKNGTKINRETASTINNQSFVHYAIPINLLDSNKIFFNIYFDMVNIGTTARNSADVYDGTFGDFPLYIGGRGGSSLFTKMTIQELRIYNKALSSEEILSNYNKSIMRDNLLLYYKFK